MSDQRIEWRQYADGTVFTASPRLTSMDIFTVIGAGRDWPIPPEEAAARLFPILQRRVLPDGR